MSDDFSLLSAWRGGDRAAGTELFERHFDAICRFFANKVDRDVDELVQRTFTACVEARDRFRGQSSFRTYLFAIAHNVLRAYLRGRDRDQKRFDGELTSIFDLGLSPTALVAERREQTLVLQALRRIPVDHQAVLELYYWEELTATELAEIFECPEGTVRGRIRRAKTLLAEQLERLGESDALVESTTSGLETWARSLRAQMGRDSDKVS